MNANAPVINGSPADPDELAPGDDDDAIVAELKVRFSASMTINGDNHREALDDLTFLSGDHWPVRVKRERELDGRPCLTINKLPTFLHQVTNDQRQNVPSIQVSPVDGDADIETAKVIQGIIRNIEYQSNADVAYDTAVNSAAAIGFGYFRLVTDYCSPESFDQEIRFKRIRNPFTVYFDPASEEPDGSDATFAIISSKVPRYEFRRQYPNAQASADSFPAQYGDGSNKEWVWQDSVRVAEYYRIEWTDDTLVQLPDGTAEFKSVLAKSGVEVPDGTVTRPTQRKVVMFYKCTALEVLERTEIRCDWIPVFPVYGDELDIDGKVIRSGLIRNAKDPSKMYDFWMPQSLDTALATPEGWSTIGAVRVGDTVFSDSGEPTKVVGKSPVYINRDCYRVTFGDGTHVDSDAQHPWVVEERGKRVSAGFNWVTRKLRTDELDPKQHCIKVAGPIQMPDGDLPIDPYVLGAWLGDGSQGSSRISASKDDIEGMRERIAAKGFGVAPARQLDRSPCFSVYGLVAGLRKIGVLNDKHIPKAYMRASVEQRLELLRGLMDTDGNAHPSSGNCNFTQADDAFADQVRELIVSLGMRVGVTKRAARVSMLANGSAINGTGSTQLAFTPPPEMAVFAMPRKLAVQMRDRKRVPRRAQQHKIVSVERIETVPVQCIAIDAPSHLFLCGKSMIPTHNTAATEEVALRPKVPYIGAEGQFAGHEDDWQQANTRSFSYLEYRPVTIDGIMAPTPVRQPMADMPVGTLQMAMHANDNIKATTGLFDSSLGALGSARSGVQERQQQRQGDVANFHYADNLARTVRHAGRCIVSMIPGYYDATRIVRTMGEDGKQASEKINQPASPEDLAKQQQEAQQAQDDGKQAKAIKTILNDVTVGKYDVVIKAGPSYDTLRQEAVDNMVEVGGKWPKLMDVAGDLVIKSMDWPGADQIAERVARSIPPELRGDDAEARDDMIQTPKGPVPKDQIGPMLEEMNKQVQEMGQALQEAKSGIEKAHIQAQSAKEVAEINAVSKNDVAELQGWIQLLIKSIQPPPVLTAKALTDGNEGGMEGATLSAASAQDIRPAVDPTVEQAQEGTATPEGDSSGQGIAQ